MNKQFQTLTLIAALGFCSAANAASLTAIVYPTRFNCAASGDPYCSVGQDMSVGGTPVINSIPNATAGSTAYSGNAYYDPRLGTTNSTSGEARAGLGWLGAEAVASVSSQPPLGINQPNLMRLLTTSRASFQDDVTITPQDPALIGKPGTFTAAFRVNGLLEGAGVNGKSGLPTGYYMAWEGWQMQISVGASSFGSLAWASGYSGYEYQDTNGVTTTVGLGDEGIVPFTAPFVFGQSFSLGALLDVRAGGHLYAYVVRPLTEGQTTATSSAQYMDTALWDGISSVKYAGQGISGFNVTSGSGVNYANPVAVPEPETWSMLLIGLGLEGLIARRNSRGLASSGTRG